MRQFLRLKVGTYRRKAFGTDRRPAYPAAAIVAFYGVMELAAEQPTRGQFESARLLKVLLEGPDGKGRAYARQVDYLIEHGDLVVKGGRLLVDGWQEMQEGDYTVAERVHRFRTRHGNGPRNGPDNAGGNGAGNDTANPLAHAGASSPSLSSSTSPSDDARAEVFAAVNRVAFVRPDSGLGIRLEGLIDRQGPEPVLAALNRLLPARSTWSDRQLVLGLENALEAIPSGDDARQADLDDARTKRNERVEAQMQARRVEHFRWTGEWDDAFGPEPEWQPSWGKRPVAA